MNAHTQILESQQAAKQRRVEQALSQCAKLDKLIAQATELKSTLITEARKGHSFDTLRCEHKLAGLVEEYFTGPDMDAIREDCEMQLRTEHKFDLSEGALDDAGYPLRQFNPSRVHPDDPCQGKGWV